MDKTRINRPDKLIAGIIFVLLGHGIHILNLWIRIWEASQYYSGMTGLIVLNLIVLNFTGVLWLTYLIFKGKNWARYYLLIYTIFSVIPQACYSLYNDLFTNTVQALHNGIHLTFMLISFYLLFSKDSSLWFKGIKQRVSEKLNIRLNFKISSICLYIAYGISLSILIVDSFSINFKSMIFDSNFMAEMFFSVNINIMLITMIIKTGTVNFLFIYSIKTGSKLAGIIYLAAIINSTFTPFFFLGCSPMPAMPLFLLWSLRVTIQLIAFLILFQKEIIYFFSKITPIKKNTLLP